MPSQGDIVLIPILFNDLSSQKRRPVIVISNDEYNRTAPDGRVNDRALDRARAALAELIAAKP